MTKVFAIPFRQKPTPEFEANLALIRGDSKLIASFPAEGIDWAPANAEIIYHLNTTSTGIERNLFYGNQIMLPLLARAKQEADLIVFLHDDVAPTKEQMDTLCLYLERIPSFQFASSKPRTVIDVDGKPRVTDWPDQFLVWRSATIAAWLEPFREEEAANYESTMLMLMNRMKATGLNETTGWTWVMDMEVAPANPQEPAPAPPPPRSHARKSA